MRARPPRVWWIEVRGRRDTFRRGSTCRNGHVIDGDNYELRSIGRKKVVRCKICRRHHRRSGTFGILNAPKEIVTICELCGNDQTSRICADHDHQTGLFRGWLCTPCNMLIAFYEKIGGDKIEGYLNKC